MASGNSLAKWGVVLILAGLSFAQNAKLDSLNTVPRILPADSSKSAPAVSQDSLKMPLNRADTVTVVKYRFNHREQIITGSLVMVCLALILAVMNNYNPR